MQLRLMLNQIVLVEFVGDCGEIKAKIVRVRE
jgi:hypothetical protein